MNREKQIEEMAKDLCKLFRSCEECRSISPIIQENCKARIYAERAITAGYRKASEVAREIFAEIEKLLGRYYPEWKFWQCDGYPIEDFAELKKKYTEEGK